MLTMYQFKKQHKGFSTFDDNFLAASALKFVLNSNIAVCHEKLLFLGVQALYFICVINALDKFRIYVNDLWYAKL